MLEKTNKTGLVRGILVLFALLGLFSISFAYYVQYIIGAKPCSLCLYQRIPYFVLGVYAFLCLVNKNTHVYYWAYVGIFVVNVVLSGYHVAIERGVITELIPCTTQDAYPADLTTLELKRLIYNAPISCKEVMFRMLGLSMAEINLIASSLIATALMVFRKHANSPR